MSTVSVRFNDKDDMLIRKYAELHNMDLSSFIRQAVLDKIEDEYDLTLFNMVWEEEKNQERISHEDLKRDLNL
ncbi:MAG TPA: CopG family transcriptional regulator [Eubacteriaceae bacterium]|nr:CopG family transcriptional regulator [Eubacteriaceae bacterium]